MKFIEALQGTPEWLQARAGAITASRFADAVSVLKRASGDKKPGDPTAAAEKYAGDVAIERISGKPYGKPLKTWEVERGHIMEAAARVAYEVRYGITALESGIVKTDDDWFGYSTDGLVDDDGMIEIKCPVASDKILAMFQTGDTSEYDYQIQGGLWITRREWCDFIMYVPDLASVGNDLYVKRIYRNEEFIAKLESDLILFRTNVQLVEAIFRRPLAANADLLKAAA